MIVIWRPRCGCLDCVVKSGALESCHPCGCPRYRARSGLLVCLLARHFSDSDMLRKLGASAAWNRGRDIAVLLVCSVCANATRSNLTVGLGLCDGLIGSVLCALCCRSFVGAVFLPLHKQWCGYYLDRSRIKLSVLHSVGWPVMLVGTGQSGVKLMRQTCAVSACVMQ